MKTLHDFIGGTLATHAEFMSLGIPSNQALEIASMPSQLNAFRDTIRQMSISDLDELVNRSKGLPVAIQGYKGVFELTGIDVYEGMFFEYSDIPYNVSVVRLPIYEMDYNKIEQIKEIIRQIL